ncbi:hypothetical protein L1987_18017 [Smallanthus sonchifolius]|uniref:Uncharacterized protein n=1 Tax=Smallanthus sonchifolius TaxID=185202 RepID=A0ACB9J212_9ASTR|nr:hypothetical protein L1987_18017 [Smallanthus sonchifolius]
MYKYEAIGESDYMLEFDATGDVTQDSALVDIDDDFLCTRPDGEGMKKVRKFDLTSLFLSQLLDELQKSGCFESWGTHDVLIEALGTEEQRGHVRGMGKFVKPLQYFFEPKTVKKYSVDERFNKIEEELQTLKRGMNNVSEGASCQMGEHEEDFEDEPLEELLVSLGYKCENIEVMMEVSIQGEALLPIPLEEEFITNVKDAVGHILTWPRHLVIRCSDLYLFEKIRNGLKRNHGICFVSLTATSPRDRKTKSRNIDDASRSVAERLSKRKDNDIILIPYNPRSYNLGTPTKAACWLLKFYRFVSIVRLTWKLSVFFRTNTFVADLKSK